MPDHNCPHKATIIQNHKELFGNGKDGLVKDFVALSTKFKAFESNYEHMEESIEKLGTAFSALAKNDSNREAVRKALGSALIKASLILGMAGTVITLIFKLA